MTDAPRSGVWARGLGLALHHFDGTLTDALRRALLDGVERGYEGPLPDAPDEASWFAVKVDRATVGLLAIERLMAEQTETATVHAIAIATEQRGNGYGTRTLRVAERRLRREGVARFYSRVPRSNGRGLYFMLRAGYAPIAPPEHDGATWFEHAAD
ncbi:MAG TPA: GNAT family N-acetyltransferase [Dehalococcoidia bacterium]|nr:GNAT family N-acetyltransferase [Dehalococcoidia bacterium]